jgi:oligoendopeptidase F
MVSDGRNGNIFSPSEDISDKNAVGRVPSWNLSDFYASCDSPKLARDLQKATQDADAFANRYQGKLSALFNPKSGAKLYKTIKAYETLQDFIGRIGSYAYLNYIANMNDPAAVKCFGDIQEKLTGIGSKLLFFTLEINRLDDAVLEHAMSTAPLNHFKSWLTELRKEKPYQLNDDLERLFHEMSVTGQAAWTRLFNESMAELRFEVDDKLLALEPALNLLMAPEESVRRKAAEALTKTLQANLRLFTFITNTLAKDKEISDRWRGFEDVAASRHLSNNVEAEVVEAMVEAVRSRLPAISHRYYAMKARWLGKDKLDHWDRNAPLTTELEPEISWDEAKNVVLTAYKHFAPEMAKIANHFFEKKWIDAAVRDGKSPGAFSHPTVPSAHPCIMMNFLGKARDVMTLAHELGHGVHQFLANEQGALMAPTPLTLAETASVFGEMLTFNNMLACTDNPATKKLLIAQKVEEKINTVVRQTGFYTFERRVHSERRKGELTSERLGQIWMEVQGETLGPAIQLDDGYRVYWTYIPHFIHAPFYVYAYAFGDCLANSLFAVYQKDASGFQERYLELLRAGGTKHHRDLLAPFGLDTGDPGFWAMGLSIIEEMIDTLETLTE